MSLLEVFRTFATEFAQVPDLTVNAWLELTAPLVSMTRFGTAYNQALALLTAHRMKMSGIGDSSIGSIGDTLRVGSYSEGETSVSFNTGQSTNLMYDGELTLTPYGLQFLSLRRSKVVTIVSAGEA